MLDDDTKLQNKFHFDPLNKENKVTKRNLKTLLKAKLLKTYVELTNNCNYF